MILPFQLGARLCLLLLGGGTLCLATRAAETPAPVDDLFRAGSIPH